MDQEITVLFRPLLIRVEQAGTRGEFDNAMEQVRASGADGVELALEANASAHECLARLRGSANALAVTCPSTKPEISERWLTELLEAAGLPHAVATSPQGLIAPPQGIIAAPQGPPQGPSLLNLMIPPTTGEAGPGSFARYQEALNFGYGLLRNLRHSAERCGIPIALEAGAGGNLLSPVELRELLDAVHTWAVGVCLDLPRISRFGRPVDWLETLGRKILAIRLAPDWPHLESLAAAMDHIDYRGPLILSGHLPGADIPGSIRGLASGSGGLPA